MQERTEIERFERVLLPRLDAASNLASWLTWNDRDAVDVVQEAYVLPCAQIPYVQIAGYHLGQPAT